jgi:hypothetical protein
MESIRIYRSFYEAIKDLPPPDQGIMWRAIVEYCFNNYEPEFTGISKIVWTLIKPNLDSMINNYNEGLKGGKHGKKGGRPEGGGKKENNGGGLLFENPNKELEKDKDIRVQIELYKKENPSKYSDFMYEDFIRYWSEPFQKGRYKGKQKWEGQDTWQISGRLATWNNNNFNKQPQNNFKDPTIKSVDTGA